MSRHPSIFVSIACFMDRDLVHTINDLFSKARRPERVHVGVCLQDDPERDRFTTLSRFRQVRVDRLPYTEALGPIYARARCEALIGDEDFFFQIDCHSRFFPDWDTILVEEFRRGQDLSDRPVISHYPINIQNMNDEEKLGLIGKLNRFRQVNADEIKMHGSLVPMPQAPEESYGISAAMLFMDCRERLTVPLDPNLHFGMHSAEQFFYSARLWTHGFDFMTPTRHSIATEYLTTKDRLPEEVRRSYNGRASGWKARTWTKVKYFLQLDDFEQVDPAYRDDVLKNGRKYGLGSARNITDYYRFIGLHEQLPRYFPYYARRAESALT